MLLGSLPALLWVLMAQLLGLEPAQQLLFAEVLAARCGHAAVVDRLVEVLLIQLLRHAVAERLVDAGAMAGRPMRAWPGPSAPCMPSRPGPGHWMGWPRWRACRGRALQRTLRTPWARRPGLT